MKTLKYWLVIEISSSGNAVCYRSKTKRDATDLALGLAHKTDAKPIKPVKIEITYKDTFDLMRSLSPSDGNDAEFSAVLDAHNNHGLKGDV